MKTDLTELIDYITGSCDHPECLLDEATGKFPWLEGFEEVEEDEWVQDHKYQHSNIVYMLDIKDEEPRYLSCSISRSGSYHSDWYYTIDHVEEVDKFEGCSTITVTITGTDHKKAADAVKKALTVQKELWEDDKEDIKLSLDVSVEKGWEL